MKIRQGFVSNSSSSSFCIYGNSYNTLDHKLEELENKAVEAKLELIYGPPYSDTVYIGRSLTTLKDEETGKQFKQGVEDKLKSVGLENGCSYFEEGWYDG